MWDRWQDTRLSSEVTVRRPRSLTEDQEGHRPHPSPEPSQAETAGCAQGRVAGKASPSPPSSAVTVPPRLGVGCGVEGSGLHGRSELVMSVGDGSAESLAPRSDHQGVRDSFMGKTPENVLVESFLGVLETAQSSAWDPFLLVISGGIGAAGSQADGRTGLLKGGPRLSSVKLPRRMSHAGVTNSCLASRTFPEPGMHSSGMPFRAAQPHAPRMGARGSSWGPTRRHPGRRWESGCWAWCPPGPPGSQGASARSAPPWRAGRSPVFRSTETENLPRLPLVSLNYVTTTTLIAARHNEQ